MTTKKSTIAQCKVSRMTTMKRNPAVRKKRPQKTIRRLNNLKNRLKS